VASNETNQNTTPEYRVGTRTDIGLRRKRNEDFLGVEKTPAGLLIVVCDGMGGHVGGERASRLAVETFTSAVRSGTAEPEALLRAAITEANNAVYEESRRSPDLKGMGTTLVAALVTGDRASLINLGDSRAYHLRSGRLSQVTRDHSYVGELVAAGRLTESEARVHPQRNIITQALGLDSTIKPDLYSVALRDGDALLLCTDGLYGMVEDSRIEQILASGDSPENACDALIAAALAGGGDDNVSVGLLAAGEPTRRARLVAEPNTLDPHEEKRSTGGMGITVWLVIALALGLVGGYFYQQSQKEPNAPAVVDSVAAPIDTNQFPVIDSTTLDSTQKTPSEMVDSLQKSRVVPQGVPDSGRMRDTGANRISDSIRQKKQVM
jgi:protein phosphatase